jgi:RNA polymerase sigma-70 factor (ECF subfamily)
MAERNEQLIDELLVMECQDGSAKALEALVARWQKRLWRYAYRLTGSTEGAWEVTQESWLGVVRGLSGLNDPARFRPWVYQIVTRKARDWIARSAKARRRRTEAVAEEPAPSPRENQETADELQSVMTRLPEPERTVLTLYYLEDLSVAEIAHVLGIPAGTVKSRLHAARKELKARWVQASDE